MKKIILYPTCFVLLLVWIMYAITACDVEDVGYTSQMHSLPTDLDLSDVCFINQDTGYISAGGIFTSGLLWKTEDGGATWDTVKSYRTGLNSLSYKNGIFSVSECGQKFHYTTDFSTWHHKTALGWWGWHKHARLADNQLLLIGGENFGSGFMHHNLPNEGLLSFKDTFGYELRDIEITNNRVIHVVGYGLIMKSTDDGNSWIVSEIAGDFFRGVDFPSAEIGYVVGEYGAVYKTTNRGDSWKACRTGNSIFADPNKRLMDLAFWDENTGFLVGSGNLVYRTTNGGKIWKKIQNFDGYADFTGIKIFNNKAYIIGKAGKLLIVNLE